MTDEPLVYHIHLIKFLFGFPNQNFDGYYFNINRSIVHEEIVADSKLSTLKTIQTASFFYEHCCRAGTSHGQDGALTAKSQPEQDT